MKLPWSNPSPSARRLVEEAGTLSHDQRWHRMYELGRQSVADPDLAQTLQALARSEVHHERLLALMSTVGSHDAGIVATLLADPSQSLALRATRQAARIVPDDVLAEQMPSLAPRCGRMLARWLWQAGRARVNDAVHPRLARRDRDHLLPWTTEDFLVAQLDADQVASLGAAQWQVLARRLPVRVRDTLVSELERAEPVSHVLRLAVRAALKGLLHRDRACGLALLSAAARRMPIGDLPMARYAAHFPDAIAGLLREQAGARASLSAQVLKRLDLDTVRALLTSDALPNVHAVFPRLHVAQRVALYRLGGEAWRAPSGALPLALVRALPGELRQAEARRAFASRLLETEPMARVAYLGCLPFEEALRLARPFLSQPEGELRAQAVAAVVHACRFEAASLGAALDFCVERENEQDPVRLAMFTALAALPTSRWEAAHLPHFATLIDAALRARDCSPQTMTAALQWLMGILPAHPDFVAETLPRLIERQGGIGRIGADHWESRISDADMQRIAAPLMALLETWIQRNRSGVAVQLILAFSRRARAVARFADLLVDLSGHARAAEARSGLAALARLGPPSRVGELIPRLLERDPGWIQVDTVAVHLHRRRQDLLTPFLTARKFGGRFASGSAAFLPGFEDGFIRWSAAQQQCYADALLKILSSPKRSAWELYGTVRRYAAMPSVDLGPIVDQARLDARDAALRDKALEALGRADGGRGVPTLIQALDDARARVAVYALRRSVTAMPAAQALELVGRVPRHKVTVAKEIVRLAGELQSEAAYAFLSGFDADASLHPDVRIALLRAYWNYLDRPQSWERLNAAATGEQPALARATIRVPQVGLTPDGQRAWGRHLALLLRHPDALIRKETLERLVAMPPAHGEPSLQAALVAQLEDVDPAMVEPAATVLLDVCARTAAPALAACFAAVQRPLSLVAIISAYQHARDQGRTDLADSASLLVDALAARRWHAGQALRLAFSVLPLDASLGIARRFQADGLLHAGAVTDAIEALGRLALGRPVPALALLESSLGSQAAPALRRIGLGLLCELAAKGGWTDEARRRLAAYREDADGWVSEAADLVRCPEGVAMPPVVD